MGGAASFCTYLRSIWQLYTQLSVHFPVAMEICNQIGIWSITYFLMFLTFCNITNFNMRLRLHLSWFARNIAHSILSLHSSAVSYFNLETFDFFGKFHSLRICKRLSLFIDISYIQHLAHKFYNWLRFVKGSGRDWNINEGRSVTRS